MSDLLITSVFVFEKILLELRTQMNFFVFTIVLGFYFRPQSQNTKALCSSWWGRRLHNCISISKHFWPTSSKIITQDNHKYCYRVQGKLFLRWYYFDWSILHYCAYLEKWTPIALADQTCTYLISATLDSNTVSWNTRIVMKSSWHCISWLILQCGLQHAIY